MTAEPWVSVDQIAEHLGVTRDSIYRWIDRKSLPAHPGWAAVEIPGVRGG